MATMTTINDLHLMAYSVKVNYFELKIETFACNKS